MELVLLLLQRSIQVFPAAPVIVTSRWVLTTMVSLGARDGGDVGGEVASLWSDNG